MHFDTNVAQVERLISRYQPFHAILFDLSDNSTYANSIKAEFFKLLAGGIQDFGSGCDNHTFKLKNF